MVGGGKGGRYVEVAANSPSWFGDEQLSLILFEANGASTAALQRALQHMRRALRGTDMVFIYGHMCAIVLPATPFVGAQVVAQRLTALLVEVEYTTQVLNGAAAQTALQRLRAMRAIEIRVDVAAVGAADETFTSDFPVIQTDRATVEAQESIPAAGRSHTKRRKTTRRERAMLADSTMMQDERSPLSAHTPTLPHLAFLTSYPPLRLFQTFPYALAQQYQCVPVGAERGVLTLATCQRLEPDTVAHLQGVTQQTIFQVRCELSLIDDVLRYWERSLPMTVSVSM